MVATLNKRNWAMALALALLMASAPSDAARPRDSAPDPAPARGLPDNQLAPLSLRQLEAGDAQLNARNTAAAIEHFEAALAADPRNRQAYIGLGRAAQADGLPGRAVRYYREALEIDPNDLNALELQGNALVERGAKSRAKENLERVKTLCKAPCPTADRLAAAIQRGPSKPEQTAAVQKADEKPKDN
ncbi:tetratricopeptide repeat protein [Sandaracinobacter sp. RS1-74]|uniref:tetratricopeptide repeat protein n=1 Tax=Sandaracinobacteroides sayramensis TaxID=2913411 RepID=UPI001EDC1857|nr:tetratricopeptide repeat protein [Sandaracinobacteroides sayramensis]MCG2842341.1 tetratricopeptide repeat protein [Sandaracinobacteroides sayramensis]